MLTINETFYSIEGEGPFIGVPTFFIRLTGCNLRCTWTPTGTTRILMSDYSWKLAKNIRMGDRVLGFENGHLKEAKVTATIRVRSEIVKLRMESGKVLSVTPEHPFYYKGTKTIRADRSVGVGIRTIGKINGHLKDTIDYKYGWLAGVIDGTMDDTIEDIMGEYGTEVAMDDRTSTNMFPSFSGDESLELRVNKWMNNYFQSNELDNYLYMKGQEAINRKLDKTYKLKNDKEFSRGYVAGMIDSSGSIGSTVRIRAKGKNVKDSIELALKSLSVPFDKKEGHGFTNYEIAGNPLFSYLLFRWKSKEKVDIVSKSSLDDSVDRVIGLKLAGYAEINHFETETHNYISEGYLSHNCDTKYSYAGGEKRSVESLVEEASKYGTRFVCITGGEPLLQKEVYPLMYKLLDKEFRIILETSGSISVEEVPTEDNMIISMDIKTPSSGMVEHNIYENIDLLASKDYIKFVIADDKDFEFAKEIMRKYPFDGEVIFQPEGGKNLRELTEKVLKERLNVRVLPQLHKFIWGDTRGK